MTWITCPTVQMIIVGYDHFRILGYLQYYFLFNKHGAFVSSFVLWSRQYHHSKWVSINTSQDKKDWAKMIKDKVHDSGEEENEQQKLKNLCVSMEAWLAAANKEKCVKTRRKAQRRIDFFFNELEIVLRNRIKRGDIEIDE